MSTDVLQLGFRFYHPEVLFLFGLVPMIIVAAWLKLRRRPHRLSLPVAHIVGSLPLKRRRRGLRIGPVILRTLVFILLTVSAAQPQWGVGEEKISAEGIEIALVLDLSGSMNTRDLYPSRLDAAKTVVREFIEGLITDRVAMVVFSGTAMTQCPMTLDYEVVKGFLDYIDTKTITLPGTNIGAAIMSGVNKFDHSEGSSDKVMILLTDGENNIDEVVTPVVAAKIARRKGIKIYTIGVGTLDGAPVPILDVPGNRFVTDKWGALMLSKLDEEMLKEIASTANGAYFHASSQEKLSDIYAEIGQMEKTKVEKEAYVIYREMFQYFLWPGVLLLLMEILIANTRLRLLP